MATPILMPRQGQSVESCILVEWLVKPGDTVTEGQPLANIETDKAVFEVESPAAGTIVELFFDDGEDIPVLTHIGAIGEPGEDVSALKPGGAAPAELAVPEPDAAPEPVPAPAAAPATVTEATAAPTATPAAGERTGVSPRARKRAAEQGLPTAGIAGSGPGGRVIERDVQAALSARPHLSAAAREAAAVGMAVPSSGSGPGGMVLAGDLSAAAAAPAAAPTAPAASTEPIVTPLSGIRKIIAERMHSSLATTAQLTLNRRFDASAILAFRARVKANADAMGLPNITINDMIAFAVARTLLRFPELNAHFQGDKIARFPQVNLGVAMDTPRGLMVPVLRNAGAMTLGQLCAALKPIAEDARKGSINPDLLSGGTFTITNMGMLGIESFTPILNAPEVGILGIGGPQLMPVSDGDGVRHVKAINLSLTIDHQAVDGGPGARFLQTLCQALENFELTLSV